MNVPGSHYNDDERKLLNVYTELLSTQIELSTAQAKQLTEIMLDKCIKEAKETNFYDFPMNFGDAILGSAQLSNTKYSTFLSFMKDNLPFLKAEGVTDNDIRWWWNMSEVERRMAREVDAISRRDAFMHFLEEGLEPPDAAFKVKTHFPTFGGVQYSDPQLKGENRPLPFELKKRIGEWIVMKMKSDPSGRSFKMNCEKAGSENAYIRQEIRNGNL